MRYYISVDAGGTKTAFLLTDREGNPVARLSAGSCSYAHIGQDGVGRLLQDGAEELLRLGNVPKEAVASAAWGIPCYGENPDFDEYITSFIPALLPEAKHHICNDAEVGFAGSLLLKPGIHLVAGTGAIGLGQNSRGETARANGWHEDFSDEGSAYWLGKYALSLFAMQADGRAEQGPLYHLLMTEWNLAYDMDIIPYYIEHLQGWRDSIARLQMLLCDAAGMGDQTAIEAYRRAAHALFETARGIYHKLGFSAEEEVPVSYFGGVYKAGDLVLAPLREELKGINATLVKPALSPVCGGILLAARAAGVDELDGLILRLKEADRA